MMIILKAHITEMDPNCLTTLIVNSQAGLLKPGFFVAKINDLNNEAIKKVLQESATKKQEASNLVRSGIKHTLFSSKQKETLAKLFYEAPNCTLH